MNEIVLILLPPLLKCFINGKRSTTGGRKLQSELTEPLEMPFQLRAGGDFQSHAEKVFSAELCLAQTTEPGPQGGQSGTINAINSLFRGRQKVVLCNTEQFFRGKYCGMFTPVPCR